ncbi:ATP-dependent DNA helicase RecG [Corynebacterium sp. AOP12-C2-36]|uniref:ATP-dependent DNA helicase RecG n=1 Tax=Corynebacterium sp. AOP12-C2-36 TaxID=3457723 RepID=UPI0040337B31
MLGWDDPRPLSLVVSPERARKLAGKPGLSTLGQALMNFPVSYVHTSGTGAMTDGTDGPGASAGEVWTDALVEGELLTCLGEVTWSQLQDNRGRKGPREILAFRVRVNGEDFSSALFGAARSHQPFITVGAKLMLSGKLKLFREEWQLRNPSYITLHPGPGPDGRPLEGEAYEAAFGAFGPLETIVEVAGGMRAAQEILSVPWLPTYPRRTGTTGAEVMAVTAHVLDAMGRPADMLPAPSDATGAPRWPAVQGRALVDFATALHDIHRPPEETSGLGSEVPAQDARTRLKFNEALALQLVMALRRADTTARHGRAAVAIEDESRYSTLVRALPYELTEAQQAALDTIGQAMGTESPMSMLLQGDVGSGKTIVALLSMLRVVDSGAQCAFLAPTEVLAAQHYRTLTGLLAGTGVTVSLLTGSQPVSERRDTLLDVISGTTDIVVGTHAVIQDAVEFYDLGMVVVDEQHRFGVRQRDKLREESPVERTPHLLVMTATPIPRTVAMTMFGDLSMCTLDTSPAGRGVVHTHVVPMWKRSWVERLFAVIREQVADGHRVFVVVPKIEGFGGVDDVADRLEAGPLQGLRIGRLHGRMTDKAEVMDELASGAVDVLVSTTVVEVGVDIPDATVMVIMDAENFGVSQLHQLRGRVGRGTAESLCFLTTTVNPEAEETTPVAAASYRRLEAVAATTDGFALAELDLRTRTEGDVLGEHQSGARDRRARLLDLAEDGETVAEARRYAEDLVAYDEPLARTLAADFTEGDQEYIERS